MHLHDFCAHLETYFADLHFDDCSNNGLQVEASTEVTKVAFAVDACLATFQQAAAVGAELLVVHHGLSWGSGVRRFKGCIGWRLAELFRNGVSLYACHLPFDAHPTLGNNAGLAAMLGLQDPQPFFQYGGGSIGLHGGLAAPTSLEALADILNRKLPTTCRLFPIEKQGLVSRVGVVSGGGADAIPECQELGLDCLVTGEMEHKFYHEARESGIAVIGGGHYATETVGVKLVMQRIQADLGLECVFLDAPTGM